MQIDWITVSAQIVNFLILVALLKHFLYGPIINAMDRREQRIAERMQEADEREQQAKEATDRYQDKSHDLDRRQEDLLKQARERAEQERSQLLDEARREVEDKRQQWLKDLRREQDDFARSLQRHMSAELQRASRQMLNDLANASLEKQIIDTFLARMASLDEETRRQLGDTDGELQVQTAFALDEQGRQRIGEAIQQHLHRDGPIDFQQSTDLVCGIELNVRGRKLGWTMNEYLEALEQRVAKALAPAGG